MCFLSFSLPKAARSCVPPAAMEPSVSCAAPARTGEFVTTSLGSAPVLLDGWWVLLLLHSQLMCVSQALTIPTPVHSTCTDRPPVWDLPPSLKVFQKHVCVALGQGLLVGLAMQGEWLDLIILEGFSSLRSCDSLTGRCHHRV